MTSRTTPVGILVIALISLVAVGCSAPTTAVFQALLDPAGTATSSPEADPAVDDATSDGGAPVWWWHPDGYAMVLPAGWSGVAVERDGTDHIIDAVASATPQLAQRMDDVLRRSKARVSAFAADPSALEGGTPMLVVLAQPTDGRKKYAIKNDVRERIDDLIGGASTLSAHDIVLLSSAIKGVRFDYEIYDPDLGELRVFSYLFRPGRTAYLVSFVAPVDQADQAEQIFDDIVESLRFGV